MPIIKANEAPITEQIRIRINKPILEKIRQYCAWVGVKKEDAFFEQAAEFILSKDKEWLNHISQQS